MPATSTLDLHRTARLTGIAYLGILVAGIFAEFVVRQSLLVPGDATTTASNIAGSEGLFRLGMVGDLAMISFDVAVAVGFYLLLRHVSRPLAMLAAAFRLIQAAVLGSNLANLADAVRLATGATEVDGAAQLSLGAMETFALTYDIALVFFGIACLLLGHLLRVSRAVPAIVAWGLSATGVAYLFGSASAVMGIDLGPWMDVVYGLVFAAELAVANVLAFRSTRVAKALTPGESARDTADNATVTR